MWSEGVFPSAEYKYLNKGTVKYRGQESVTEFSTAAGYLPGICGGHVLLHTGFSSGTRWALKQRHLLSLSCVQTEATAWLWCPRMGVGQWVKSVGDSDASLGREKRDQNRLQKGCGFLGWWWWWGNSDGNHQSAPNNTFPIRRVYMPDTGVKISDHHKSHGEH